MDWFPQSIGSPAPEKLQTFAKPCELTAAIKAMRRVLKPGGRVFFRSAAMRPWYTQLFAENGFAVQKVSVSRSHRSGGFS